VIFTELSNSTASFETTVPGSYTVTATTVALPAASASTTFTVGANVPSAPTLLRVTGVGNGQVSLAWSPPASDGGSPIAGYKVTHTWGTGNAFTTTINGSSTTAIVGGLTNGIPYSFTVAAFNAAGAGMSPESNSVTATPAVPATVPAAPLGYTAMVGNGVATLGWPAPSSDGGSPITGYTVTVSPAPGSVVVTGRTAAVSGLTNGVAYTFTVAAINAVGQGPASVPFGPFTPAGVPGAPPGLIVTPGNASAALSWTAPPSNGSAIIEYSVSVSPATGFYTISGTSASVIDLANGVAYTFSVAATNGAGTGPASYGTATPAGIPGAPTGLTATAGDRAATLGWTPPATNGSAITGYVVSVTPSAGAVVSVNPATATASVTGLTNDQSYTFTVSAANGVGTGPVSPPSAAFTPKAPVTVGTFNVSGAINSDGYVVIRVMKDGASFSGANVTLTSGSTGVLIPNIGGMTYSTNSYVMPASGQQLTLTVTDGVNTASGSVAVPSRPTITAPTPGLVVPAASPLTVTWTVAPNINPGRFEIQGCWPTPCGGNSWATPGATVRSHTLAANFFPIGSAVSMVLYAVNDLPVTGAATAGSNVWVNARAPNPGYLNFQAAGAPGAPTALTAAPGDGNAYLSWTAPASDGGSAIAGYVVNITPATGNPTSITVSGTTTTVVNLTNGIAYTFTVAAFNGAGSMGPASTPPVTVTPSAPFLAPAQAVSTVAAGENSTFFLAPGGAAKALGQNIDGQLGTGSVAGAWVPNPIPVAMPGGVAVRSIDGGRWHGMAIDSNGGLWGWGNGTATAIGAATMAPVSIVLGAYPASVTATAISAGSRDNGLVLMSNGHVWGIGDDSSGQFGPAPFTGDTRLVSDAGGTVAVAAGATHSMLLASDGTVWTLGMNEWGQLGDGTSSGFGSTFKRTVPQRVIGLDQVVAIAAGEYHSVALRVDGTVWTWGFGDNSQLGNGGVISSPTPVQVRGVNGVGFLTNVDAITTGSGHTLALLGDGTLRAWGFNRNGQLGDGSRLDRATPVAVIGLASITDIAGGASHSVARRSDGTIWAWGLNQSGQLGTGAPSGTAASYSPVPVQVGAVTVTVTPGTASVVGGGTQAFTAVVAGAVNQAVTWRVQETGGGTISAAGLYTAPSTPGTYTVEAQSGADPSKIGTAIVTVTAIPPVATRTRLNLLDVRSDVPVVGLTTFNFRASVLPAAASSPVTGTVTFTVGGVAQAPVVTTGGSAVFTVVSEVMPSITASYNGDTGHFPSTSFPFATGARRVPDSVDAVCSDGTQTIACPTTPGSVGFGQDGTFSTNPPTFAVSATGLSIADSVTGLVWTPLDTSGTAREYPQAQAYCEGMAASAYDSITDWRLPTAREALTIVNTGRNGAAVGPSSFFLYVGTTQNAGIWTSDGYQADPASNWILGLNYPVPRPVPRTGWSPWPGTACVSSGSSAGGSIPTTGGSFLVNLPGSPDIRRDLATGLYWQAGTAVGPGGATTFTWLEAINYCNSLNTPPALGGLTSWRLPNLKELWTLVDITGTSPAIDTSVFPDTVSGAYWSSSPMSIPPTMAYLVDFSDGTGWTPSLFGTTSRLSVRCAAGGVLQVFGY
jgi:alpha-tubulin suppressor-like RCC1 family protein